MVKMIVVRSDLNGRVIDIESVKIPRTRFIPKKLILEYLKDNENSIEMMLKTNYLKDNILISNVSFEYEKTCIYIRSKMQYLNTFEVGTLTTKIF